MDCNIAENLIFKRAEVNIGPEDAKGLHSHVLECETCRESYLVFDECMEAFESAQRGEFKLETAPVNFTMGIMAQISNVGSSAQIAEAKEKGWLVLKLFWGFSAIIFGIILYLMFNPGWIEGLAESSAAVSSALMGIEQAFVTIQQVFIGIAQSIEASTASSLSIYALVFVGVMVFYCLY